MSHESKIERVPFTCTYDCGGRCELVACVQDGRLVRIDTPPGRPDTIENPRLVPCLRGRARRRLQSSRKRLLKPMRRTGARGSEEFEEISWDEALDEVSERLAHYKDGYGAESILHIIGYGSIGGRGFSGAAASGRFFSHWGSVTGTVGNPSSWCAGVAAQWMMGGTSSNIYAAELLESRLIILWGMNPAENRHGINLAYYVSLARDRGARVVLIDPRYTDSGVLADQWIPIKPGTDVALMTAIAHIWETAGTYDTEFISTHTVGYEAYRGYLLGEDDNTPKTPEWAAKITGISEDTIRQLAHEYASTKPAAALLAGLGPQRSRYGEQVERALITLACMSGNMGTLGGGMTHGGRHPVVHIPVRHLPYGSFKSTRNLKVENWAKDILEDGLNPPIKMAFIVATNAINRSSNTRANARALEKLDYVVVNDEFLTPTARYADIVFPICTDLERMDIVGGQGLFYNGQPLEPAGEAQTDYWVFARLAERLGLGEAYTDGKTQAEWVEYFLEAGKLDTDDLQRNGVIRSPGKPSSRLASFREDPQAHPLNTSSGLIEITCAQAEEHNLPIIPSYVESSWDGSSDCPLRLITPHSKLRANSSGHANPWLQHFEPHRVWISSKDAEARGIVDGELVEVFNQYGTVAIPAKVTERIMPGVTCIYQGVWYQPNADGVDIGGCPNVLTGHHLSPTGGMAVHSEWVEIRRKKA